MLNVCNKFSGGFAPFTCPLRNFNFNRQFADVLTHTPFFGSFAGSRVNTPHMAVTFVG